jgi:ABC-type transport system involved in cytochrome bd biosynthesis fused ATPase/permease subunit
MEEGNPVQTEKQQFKAFNDKLEYILNNAFRLIRILFKFLVKTGGILFITMPFVLVIMCIVAPEKALNALEAINAILKLILDRFKAM